MRVLHAYNQHRGGGGSNNATRATIDLCRADGIETEVFTRRARDLPAHFGGRLRAALTALSGRRTVREFESVLEAFRPDVVHIHEIFPLVPPWILPACTARGVPVVASCVDYRLTCPVVTHLRNGQICTRCVGGRPYWAAISNCRGNRAESATMALYAGLVGASGIYRRHVARLIAPSEFTRSWLIQHLPMTPDAVTAIAPAVDMPRAAADAGLGTYVGFAGRFSPEKGIETLLDAGKACGLPLRFARNAESLVTVNVPAELTVVTRTRDDLAQFYRHARMVVVPSIWFETFGLVGAEAMSHGIPVVAARIGAVEELVSDGEDGLLFEPGNARDLAEKIRLLWDDPELCRRLGAAARAKAEQRWSTERHVERLRAVYEGCLGRSGDARGDRLGGGRRAAS